MANKYWVGGTATWDATAGTKWASTSGGTGGEPIPSGVDDVYFDANSGTITCTLDFNANAKTLNLTDFTGTLAGITEWISLTTFIGSPTASFADGTLFFGISDINITTNGMAMCGFDVSDGGSIILQDTFTQKTTGTNLLFKANVNGNIITNGHTVTISKFDLGNSSTRTVDITNSTINIVGNVSGCFTASGTGLTFTSTGSTIKVTGGASATFAGGGKTFNNVEFNGATTLTGANTFNDLKVGAGATLKVTSGTTQTVSSFSSGGTAGNLATIQALTAGSAFTLSDTTGTNSVNYMSIKDSTATGGATWNAYASTDVSGNTGWNFLSLPTNTTNFFQFI